MHLSYWETDTYFKKIDIAVIGSGIVGLNAVLYLKKRFPKLNIIVLERGFLPSGASTKNAGFACYGSVSELNDDLIRHSEKEVFDLVEKRWKGLKRLRKNLGDAAIDYRSYGGFEVFNDEKNFTECVDKIKYFNSALSSITGLKEVYQVADKKINAQGLSGFKHMIRNRGEGQIDTGKMMDALINKVQKAGVKIFNGIGITSFARTDKHVNVQTDRGFSFLTKRLLICTNGFAKQLLPLEDVHPARAQVLITSPIKKLKLKGAFHFDKGYYYFRNIGDRVLLGGGRHLDMKNEETDRQGLTELVQLRLEELLRMNIIPYARYTIEQRWSGIMGLGPRKSSILKEVQKNVFCAVRLGGMGVAIGSLVGEEAADMVGDSL